MESIRIVGGNRLEGTIPIHGAKNSALPLLAESKMSFAKAKLINIAVGLLVGYSCLILL